MVGEIIARKRYLGFCSYIVEMKKGQLNAGLFILSIMVYLLNKALAVIPRQNLWVNPDCGLKTRKWPETEAALKNMVDAVKQLRGQEVEAE